MAAGAEMQSFVPLTDVLRRWFGEVPLDDIKSGNLAELMSYGFLYKRRYVGCSWLGSWRCIVYTIVLAV